jgi:peroxiredoxin family protein
VSVFSAVVYDDGLDRWYEAVAFAAAARARGETVQVFLRGPALAAYLEDRWAPPAPPLPSVDDLRFQHQSPTEFLDALRPHGRVSVLACSAWVRLLRLDPARVAARVDAVVGLNAFLAQSAGGAVMRF